MQPNTLCPTSKASIPSAKACIASSATSSPTAVILSEAKFPVGLPAGVRVKALRLPGQHQVPTSVLTQSLGRARLQPWRQGFLFQAASAVGVGLAMLLAPVAHAQSPQLTAVFTQMDAASKRFENATASVQRDNYEKVVRETTTEKGTVYLDRKGNGIEFGATVYPTDASGHPATTPSRILSYNAGTLQMYTPATKQVDVFRSGANQNKLEGYLALGFGANSQDLQKNWTVTDAGPETLTDNGQPVNTEKLVLVSKDPGVQTTFKQITLWLDPARDVSLKQVFDTPGGDRQTATYTDIRLNTKVNTSPYKIPTGKGISVIQH